MEVFKMFKYISAIPFETFFQLDNNNRTRGHSAKIKKNKCRTDLRKHFFSERVVNRWNSLKEHTIQANGIISFKRHLEKKEHKDGPFHGLIRWSMANLIHFLLAQQV